MRTLGAGILLAVMVGTSAGWAQQPRLRNLHEPSFDMWCQETQHLPPERCDKRLSADDAAYRAYLDSYESYETQQLNQQAIDRRIDRSLQNNPIDQPPGRP